MRPTHQPAAGGLDPLHFVEELARALSHAAIKLCLCLALGLTLARMMRRLQTHYAWAAIALAVLALARGPVACASSSAGIVAFTATVWGRRWHRQDLDGGADLAEMAARRRRPPDVMRSLSSALLLRCCRPSLATLCAPDGELALGREERGRVATIPFGGAAGGTHTLVVGATGSGKTVTQSLLAVRAIERGMGAVVLDPKGDRALAGALARAAQGAGREFIAWSPDGASVYNPYARGAESEIADKVLAGERFTEPHYMRQAQRYIGHVVRALRGCSLEVSLAKIACDLDPERLELRARLLSEPLARPIHEYLDSLTPRQRTDLAGVRDRLAILVESEVGRWLDPETIGGRRFNLLDAVRARAAVYFDLDADSRPMLAQMLAVSIVQDLQTTVAALQERPSPTLVVIDEFSAVAPEHVVRLFGRARAAGVSVVVGTQELSDLRPPGRERLLEQVLGNLSAIIVHRQIVPDSAALLARLAGTRGAWRTSLHSDGRTTRTRHREGLLTPERLLRLESGAAAVVVPGRLPAASVVRIQRAAADL